MKRHVNDDFNKHKYDNQQIYSIMHTYKYVNPLISVKQ